LASVKVGETMAYFVVTYEQGPSWAHGRGMREQSEWTEHAAYVNKAMYAGRVVVGGPLGDGRIHRAMLITDFQDEAAISTWISEDPWIRSGVLGPPSVVQLNLLVSFDDLDPILEKMRKLAASN
jgi:uncharacterized protein YciI